VADALSGLDIDGLRIQQEEAFTFLPETEHSSIEFPMHHAPCTMHTVLIFKEQVKVQGLRGMESSQPYYSMQHMTDMTFCVIRIKSVFLNL
jgi:hypothetical protein